MFYPPSSAAQTGAAAPVRCPASFSFLAGTPPATVLHGTSLVTTAPAATTAPSPMVTPGQTVALDPIHTRLPMTMGAGCISFLRSGSSSWFKVAGTTLWPIRLPSPMVMPP